MALVFLNPTLPQIDLISFEPRRRVGPDEKNDCCLIHVSALKQARTSTRSYICQVPAETRLSDVIATRLPFVVRARLGL